MGGDFIKKTIIVLPAVASLQYHGALIVSVIDASEQTPKERVQESPVDFAGGVGVRLSDTSDTSSVSGTIGLSVSPMLLDHDSPDFS